MAKIFKVPFAATGDKTVVPIPTQPDGSVSWTQGYGFDYQRKLDGSDPLAKPFPRNQHNQILNDITTALGEIQVNGFPLWSADGAPYPINATVRHDGVNYVSRIVNNSAIPADGASWRVQGDIPVATESVQGLVKLATFTEAGDSSNNSSVITPQKLISFFFAKRATEGAQGIAAIATKVLSDAGTDNTSIITPKRLSERLSDVVVSATTAVKGIIRIATSTEAGAGSSTDTAITPKSLSDFFYARTSSESSPGISAIATQTEANAGVDDSKFITAKKLAARIAASVVSATTSVAGVIRIATTTEVGQGTSESLAVSPKTLFDFFFSRTASEGAPGVAYIANQTEVNAVTNDTKFVTPRKLGLGFATYQEAVGGYVVFPSWLGRIIIQWGNQTIPANTASTYQLSVSFASLFGSVVAGNSYTGTTSQLYAPHANPVNLNQVVLENTNAQPMKIYFIAIGR